MSGREQTEFPLQGGQNGWTSVVIEELLVSIERTAGMSVSMATLGRIREGMGMDKGQRRNLRNAFQ
jgi:hypothetical protein